MSQPIGQESLDYERYVDGLRRSKLEMLELLKMLRDKIKTGSVHRNERVYFTAADYDGINAAIASAEGVVQAETAASTEERFYIQSKGYIGNSLIWWKKTKAGYTAKLEDALIVSRAEAESICRDRPDEDIMWPVTVIDAITSRQVDSQDLPKAEAAHA